MRVYKQNGTKGRLFEMMSNVNKGLINEDFNYHDAEMDHLGQQDLQADQEEQSGRSDDADVSKTLAQILKNNRNGLRRQLLLAKEMGRAIPAYVQSGSVQDAQNNPLGLGFRDLENAGLVTVTNSNDMEHTDTLPQIVVTGDNDIYGIDTKKTYKKGDRIV